MNPIEKLARKVARLEHQIRTQARTPQLAYSSLDNGSIQEYDGAGNVVAWYGRQVDGTHGAVVVNGPKPATPTLPTAEPRQGGISVRWDGFFEGGQIRPMDLDFVRVLLADNDAMTGARTVGLMVASGTVAVNLAQGIYFVALLAESKPGITSDPTDPVEIEVTPIMAGDIGDGEITAPKLEPEMQLVSTIIAGDPNDTHAEMSPTGFRVFAGSDIAGQPPTEAIRLGVAETDDYLSISDANGIMVASMSQDGVISGKDLNLSGTITVGGESLLALLKRSSSGLKGWGAQYSNPPSTTAQMGIFEISLTLDQSRMYEITTSPVRIFSDTSDSKHSLRVRGTYSAAGTPATPGVGSQLYATTEDIFPHGDDYMTLTINKIANFASGNYRFLLVYSVDSGGGAAQAVGSNEFPIEMWFKDIGPYTGNLQVPNQGGGTVNAPAATTYTKQWAANGIMSYDGNNNQYQNGYMFQGPSPAGWGNLKSLATFPDMTAELAGATINNVRVYFNFVHWYNNAGGTAYIGLHGHTGIPGTFAAPGAVTHSPGWPKPGARWVDIPIAHWNKFKSGEARGVSLEGDGSFGTYGYAQAPVLEITYTK